MKSLVTSLLISAAILLAATQSASSKPGKGNCINFTEEAPSQEIIIRKFPQFNIQLKIPANYKSLLLQRGEVLVTDSGTYKYLQCLQNNPQGLGKGTFGIIISDANKLEALYRNLNQRMVSKSLDDVRFIVYSNNLWYVALRIKHPKGETDIRLEGYNTTTEQEVKELIKELLKINKDLEVITTFN
ncbi:MAG: hypothetical protein HEQ14_14635 [Aphanizomenon flos-aquae CP01]|jgi:hypothetical protein|nr:hypothetical protein [Aphanizomenon flos-aquae CP01]